MINFYSETDFKLQKDEFLFHSEGFIPFRTILNLFGLAVEKVKPITVSQLLVALQLIKNLQNTKSSIIPTKTV